MLLVTAEAAPPENEDEDKEAEPAQEGASDRIIENDPKDDEQQS